MGFIKIGYDAASERHCLKSNSADRWYPELIDDDVARAVKLSKRRFVQRRYPRNHTSVRAFAAAQDFNRYLVVYLANPTTGITGLYRDLLLQLGVEPPFSKPRLVARIRSALDDLISNKHRAPVIVLDEAHLLTQPMFEQLRLLFSDKMDSQSLATVVLVGQPDLRRTLHLTTHEAFNQRLTVRYHLGPLDLQETIGYVKHQALVAGHKAGTLFTDYALQRVFEYTKGIPRRINQVCTTALMAALIDQKSVLNTGY